MTFRAQMWFLWLSSWILRCTIKPFIFLRYIRRSKKLPPIHSKLLLHSATTLARMIRTRQVCISLVAIVCIRTSLCTRIGCTIVSLRTAVVGKIHPLWSLHPQALLSPFSPCSSTVCHLKFRRLRVKKWSRPIFLVSETSTLYWTQWWTVGSRRPSSTRGMWIVWCRQRTNLKRKSRRKSRSSAFHWALRAVLLLKVRSCSLQLLKTLLHPNDYKKRAGIA